MAVPPGRVVYTQMLNDRGGIECDLTVTRLAEDRYFIVTSAGTAIHDFAWIQQNIPADARVVLNDQSAAYGVLGVMGPSARALLSRLTDADLANGAFPFLTAREIDLAYGRALATRITYVGELGWELYIPTDLMAGIYEAIVAEGEDFGLRLVGYHALDSLRSEKGYRHWGHDIAGEDTPFQAGLGFAVALEKNVAFIGRDALLREHEHGLSRRLVQFTLDDPEPLLLHDEPIWRDGVLVGRTTSGAYGHTLGRAVGMGYVSNEGAVDNAFINGGAYEIEIAGERYPAAVHLRPPYDPKGERIRA